MIKKIFAYFVICTVFMFIGNIHVNASYTCGYNLSKQDFIGIWNLYIDYTVDGDKIFFSSEHGAGNLHFSVIDVMDFYVDNSYNNLSYDERIKKLAMFMDGKCQRQVYVCKGHGSSNSTTGFSVLFDGQFQSDVRKFSGTIEPYFNSKSDDEICVTPWKDEKGNSFYRDFGNCTTYDGNNDCFLVDLYEDTTTGKIVDNLNPNNCIFYNDKLSTMKTKYKDCKDNGLCYDYNTLKSELRSHCNFVTQYTNYNNPCLYSCMNLGNDIAEIENTTLNGSSCNVSDKIWLWIANIFKWVKYFAPVLVIVLGILDFIKAIASQSDDEMKKVQGRFFKRLIAAALLFVIPFLIEFALNAFHLVTDNPYCSLI